MPVTLKVAAHPPDKWEDPKVSTAEGLLKESCPQEYKNSQGVLESSFHSSLFDTSHVSASRNGFVWAVFQAYSHHHNLTIRPEDVWFSIITQLSFYINAHAEDLRSFFVSHEGQQELEDTGGDGGLDFGNMALRMTKLIEEKVVDKEFRSWIMPDFSTTTESDKVVAAVLMMGAMQKYFSYFVAITCGIPSATLLGERKDWADLVKKLDKLYQLGDEPARFAQLLRPVLNHFVLTFDSPDSITVRNFWGRCAHRSEGSGIDYLTGWISVFCFWSEEGNRLYFGDTIEPTGSPEFKARNTELGLDDALAREVDIEKIPAGFASVPLTIDDDGRITKTVMLAGLFGIQAMSKAPITPIIEERSRHGPNSIQPFSGWLVYVKKDGEDGE
ncbi:DUF4419 domain-containing protein [Aspergillus candidus]|uniref:DUF4419 domain protein n=1 Tax=Aspergillus candidus TaxID=41067 RepID=A0A2I2FGM9_ASPCN|nr:hypothetical protein BDW47DRAFT_116293 [Aspergillus candidus]PLB39781.1 hypothetical protein BDW47DRAFT_116293 [Aspergillus candidus]